MPEVFPKSLCQSLTSCPDPPGASGSHPPSADLPRRRTRGLAQMLADLASRGALRVEDLSEEEAARPVELSDQKQWFDERPAGNGSTQ